VSDLESFHVDIRCIELVELVTEYLDGVLSRADLDRFNRHVAGCDACGVYVDQIAMTITLTAETNRSGIELPGNFDELLSLFVQHHAGG
jgi:hypothetical protein